MLGKIKSYAEAAIPSPEVLHNRAATHYEKIEIEPGNVRLLPKFESEVVELQNILDKQKVIVDRQGNTLGTRYWDDVRMLDGIDRGVTTYIPSSDYASGYPFSLVMDTAWFTGLEGHNDRIAERFMRELGVPVVVMGPEFTAAEPDKINGERCLGKLAIMCTSFSQMRSMEASAEIYTELCKERPHYGLTESVIGVGESRGAMGEQIRRLQLMLRGVTTIHSDLTDPCVHRHALKERADLYHLAMWPKNEVLGSIAVGAALLRQGDLRREATTVPVSMRYLVGAVLGTGPSLLSGEEGIFPSYTPLWHPQHISNFKNNKIAHTDERRQSYANHYQTTIVSLKGPHLGLAYPSVQDRVIGRSHQVGMHALAGLPINWNDIHATGRKSTIIKMSNAA